MAYESFAGTRTPAGGRHFGSLALKSGPFYQQSSKFHDFPVLQPYLSTGLYRRHLTCRKTHQLALKVELPDPIVTGQTPQKPSITVTRALYSPRCTPTGTARGNDHSASLCDAISRVSTALLARKIGGHHASCVGVHMAVLWFFPIIGASILAACGRVPRHASLHVGLL